MDQNFNQWLSNTYTPGRFDVLSAALESIESFHGPMLDHWQAELMANIGYTDTFGTQQVVEQATINFQNETLTQFGVFVNLDIIGPQHTHMLDKMIRCLSVLDQYDIPQAILSIIAGEQSATETFSELVAEVLGGRTDDYLETLREVSPQLIKRIKRFAEEKLTQQAEALNPPAVNIENEVLRLRVFTFMGTWNDQNPLTKYIRESGKLDLPFATYIDMFGNWLASESLNFEEKSANALVLMTMMNDELWDSADADIVGTVTSYFTNLYPNVLRSMKVRNAFVKRLAECRHERS
jgi:hypothetical protein